MSLKALFLTALITLVGLDVSSVSSAPLITESKVGKDLANLSILKQVNENVKATILCSTCTLMVDTIRKLMESNTAEDLIVEAVTEICIVLKIEDKYICTNIVKEFKTEVLYIFDHTALSTREICGTLLNNNCGTAYDPFHQNWTVSIPGNKPPLVNPSTPKVGSPTNRILQLSDIHWDYQYTPGLQTDCGEPLCCRPPNKKGTSSNDSAGQWGDLNCDIPFQTFINLLQQLNNTQDQFDWIYITGDLPAHYDWNQTREDQLYSINTIFYQIAKYLPNKPLFYSFGNHESAPVNSFPPPYITGENSETWLYNGSLDSLKYWINTPDALSTFKYGGYYSVDYNGLRIISLQTNFGNNLNWWLLINGTDPGGMLDWLIEKLSDAEEKKMKVHIIGHIPPTDCLPSWKLNYEKILWRYENIIVGQFFGHVHVDQFQVVVDIEDSKARPYGVIYKSPSVTSYTNQYPSYRIYTIDGTYNGSSRQVLDHVTYYLNLTDANLTNKPKWEFEYSAKETYGMKDLSPESWLDVLKHFNTDDDLFTKYYQYQTRRASLQQCSGSCKKNEICGALASFSPGDVCQLVIDPNITVSQDEIMLHKQARTFC